MGVYQPVSMQVSQEEIKVQLMFEHVHIDIAAVPINTVTVVCHLIENILTSFVEMMHTLVGDAKQDWIEVTGSIV